jgi:hypothetical protein
MVLSHRTNRGNPYGVFCRRLSENLAEFSFIGIGFRETILLPMFFFRRHTGCCANRTATPPSYARRRKFVEVISMPTKSSGRKYGKKASQKVKRAMHEMKRGELKSGKSGKKVKSRKQAIAIGLSEARRAGGKVPAKKSSR